MTINTGWSQETDPMQQARNLAAQLRESMGAKEAGKICGDLLVKHDFVTPEFLRELAGVVRDNMTPLEAIATRQQCLEAELAENPPKERALAIINELAEIVAWQARQMDFGEPDARICAKYNNPL